MVATFVSERFSFKTFFLGNDIFKIFGYTNYSTMYICQPCWKFHEVGQKCKSSSLDTTGKCQMFFRIFRNRAFGNLVSREDEVEPLGHIRLNDDWKVFMQLFQCGLTCIKISSQVRCVHIGCCPNYGTSSSNTKHCLVVSISSGVTSEWKPQETSSWCSNFLARHSWSLSTCWIEAKL